ncbi:transposase [Candidatus Parcubacteria bacterium]|nr:transposase [Candidatus Parcubacteria bacterium]
MPRTARIDVGGYVYHVINRANARVQIFDNDEDYKQFEYILTEATKKYNMRLLAYCIMPNHWHLVLYPHNDRDMGLFMGWLTNTHTRRWHTAKKTIGQGHLYQGRYKSFLCQNDKHFLILVRYVERNAKKANLVKKAEDWRWSSGWRRKHGTTEQKKILSEWPVLVPNNYLHILNEPQAEDEEKALERATEKGTPFGNINWVQRIIKKFGLEQTVRNVGRPRKK